MASITVFTPTFNRKHLIGKLYESLCNQTCKDFIWLVVDDGSSDDTESLINEWKKENKIEIEYVYKKNGGMHTAHNTAYRMIKTELNVCIDSDDSMTPDAVEKILSFWKENGNEKLAGIMALDADTEGNVIGSALPESGTVISIENLTKKYKLYGDKKFIYRTSVINSVPEYPEYEGEKLVPLSYKYWLVDKSYPFVIMNRVVCLVDYQPNGSTNTIKKQYFESPRGFLVAKRELLTYPNDFKTRLRSVLQYVAFSKMTGEKNYVRKSPKKLLTAIFLPLGIVYWKYICRNEVKK